MNVLTKVTLKNLKLNKKRTIVTIIGITLSVALITAVSSMFFSARDSLIKYEKREKGNYHYSFINVPKEDLKYFEENRYFESMYFMKNIGYAELKESKNESKPYIFIKGFDEKALNEAGVNLIDGRLPQNETEILIPSHLKTNGRVEMNIGDSITIDVGTRMILEENQIEPFAGDQFTPYNPEYAEESIINAESKTYKIVGIMERLPYSIEQYSSPGYTFVTKTSNKDQTKSYDIYTRYTKDALKNRYEVTANILDVDCEAYTYLYSNNGEINLEKIKEYEEKIGEFKYNFNINENLIDLETNIFGNSMTEALGIVVIIVVAIIIFTSVFCIKNSFNISITEKTKQYGMLSTVGATSKQIKRNVFTEALLLGIIGIPLGIICGLMASYILIIISNILIKNIINFELVYTFSIVSIIFAIILGLVTLYLSAWNSAYKASKITPITAIRNSEDIKIKSKKIKSPKYIKRIFGIGGDISYKNIKRNNKKYRATVISIVVCVSVFIALSSFISLAFRTVQNEFSTTDYNIVLSYSKDSSSNIVEKAHEVLNYDNIIDYSIINQNHIYLENNNIEFSKEYLMYFPDINKTIELENEDGIMEEELRSTFINVYKVGEHSYKKYLEELNLKYEDVKDKGILINDVKTWVSQKEAKNGVEQRTIPIFGYKKGDHLNWKRYTQEEDENNYVISEDVDIEIALLTEKNPFGLKSASYGMAKLILSDEQFDKIFYDTIDSYNEEIAIYSDNASKLQDEIDKNMNDEEYSLLNTEEQVKSMQSFYTLIAIFLYGFIIVIALIGITNIFNTITTNMELRSREFATLRSIGMTNKEFKRMIRLESFFYGTKSLIIGIPIGCILSYVIYHFLTDGDSSIKYKLPLIAIIISTLAVFLLITCIMKYSINKINKQNTIETIRNENI